MNKLSRFLVSATLVLMAPFSWAGPPEELNPLPEWQMSKMPDSPPGFQRHEKASEIVERLGSHLASIASRHGMSEDILRELMKKESGLFLEPSGRLLYAEPAYRPLYDEPAYSNSMHLGSNVPLKETFKLHSRPGSSKTIFLDFDGYFLENTSWNEFWNIGATQVPAFDIDGLNGFSEQELDAIQKIWREVSDDFSVYDINVTTEEPPSHMILRSNPSDSEFGMVVVFTQDSWVPGSLGGVAYLTSFNDVGNYYKPAWVFNPHPFAGMTASHEIGHTLGLNHDGFNDGRVYTEYFDGHGQGVTSWGPIMGAPFSKSVVQWSRGIYAFATNLEDDLLRMQLFGAELLSTDGDNHSPTPSEEHHPDLAWTAGTENSFVTVQRQGSILTRAQADSYYFETAVGYVNLIIEAEYGNNLDLKVSVRGQGDDGVISVQDRAAGQPIKVGFFSETTMTSGDVTELVVEGEGYLDGVVSGYEDYGSLGKYRISGSVPNAKYQVSAPVVWEAINGVMIGSP